MKKSKDKLGQILLREKIITEEELKKALEVQKREHSKLGDILVNLNLVSEKDIVVALAKQLSIPYASYGKGLLRPQGDQNLLKLVPEEYARRHLLLPISKHLNSLTVAFVDPLDLITIDNLRHMTGCEINPIIST
ncbi:MAG: type II secretion system protein GspE, partial [Candidatus Omnitrophica bacterium]|nr:type II secretion system protein GspE [Candidatus Omnitrophota bacterium]